MRPYQALTRSSMLIAVGIAASLLFHLMGVAGSVVLPLHFPALMAGLMLGWRWGAFVGFVLPLMSAIATGMPPLFPSACLMVPELALYGAVSGLLRKPVGLYPALIVAMIIGRLGWGLTAWLMIPIVGLHIPVWSALTTSIVIGAPGIIGQLILMPLLITRLEKLESK